MISPGANDRKAIYPILEQEDKTLDEIAAEVLEVAFGMFVKKAKYAVVVQAHTILDEGTEVFGPGNPARRSGVLDVFGTEKQAQAALDSVISRANRRYATAWAVPMHFEKPKDYWAAVEEIAHAGRERKMTNAEELALILQNRPKAPDYCDHVFITSDNAVQKCTLDRRHEGRHQGFSHDGDGAPLNNPRRLVGLPIGEEDLKETDK